MRSIWRGQLFLFDKPPAPVHSSRQGARLLIAVALLEAGARPLLSWAAVQLGWNGYFWWLAAKIAVLMLIACVLVRAFAKMPLAEIGLRRWSRWSPTEKHFFPQITVITLVVFGFTASAGIRALWGRQDLSRILLFVCVPQLVWGFYQEFVYRGMLQNELVRRWGAWKAIPAGNLIFTFGPLHAYHFGLAWHHPAHLWIFPAIFAIGLYFGVVYYRSGNLAIAGILHGLGDWFIDGLDIVGRMPG